MMVTFRTRTQCADCDEPWPGILVRRIRINKRSIRTVDSGGLGGFVPLCPNCKGMQIGPTFDYLGLTDESLAKVNEWRSRKDWPPMRQADFS